MHTYYFTPIDREAATITSFLSVCRQHPGTASDHLRQGFFEPWLRDEGHVDLAELAGAHREDLGRFLQAAGAKRDRPRQRAGASRRHKQK
jgi:hypothetical protein